jgi:rubrerythrin
MKSKIRNYLYYAKLAIKHKFFDVAKFFLDEALKLEVNNAKVIKLLHKWQAAVRSATRKEKGHNLLFLNVCIWFLNTITWLHDIAWRLFR